MTKDKFIEMVKEECLESVEYSISHNGESYESAHARFELGWSHPDWIDWLNFDWDNNISKATREDMLKLVGSQQRIMHQNMSSEDWEAYKQASANTELETLYYRHKAGDECFIFDDNYNGRPHDDRD